MTDVLTEVACRQLIAEFAGCVEELPLEKVDLAQVRLSRIPRNAMEVLDSDTRVRVSLHADPLQQGDLLARRLAEPVLPVFADGHDAGSIDSCHTSIISGELRPGVGMSLTAHAH